MSAVQSIQSTEYDYTPSAVQSIQSTEYEYAPSAVQSIQSTEYDYTHRLPRLLAFLRLFLPMDNGQWTMDNGQWTQWTAKKGICYA
jgi:hypothetical protein